MGLKWVPVEAAASVPGDRVFVDRLVQTFKAHRRPVKPQQRLPNKI
jgi:hypothetical protein